MEADLGKRLDDLFASDFGKTYGNARAFLVVVGGQPVVERYYQQSSRDTTINIQSAGKSIMSTLIGIALDEGRLRSVDQTLFELLPPYRTAMTPAVRAITLSQLLTMTAGLPGDEGRSYPKMMDSEDWVRGILAEGPTQPSGQFRYASAGSHLLSVILSEATGRSVLDYAREKLFTPLGIRTMPAAEPVARPENLADGIAGFAWPTDPQGHHTGNGGQKLTAADMAKLGQLWLDKGKWGDRQLVSVAWMNEATRAHTSTGSPISGAYGYQFWLTKADGHDAFAAAGYGGQLVEMVPDLDLVVVVLSRSPLDPTAPGESGTTDAGLYMELVSALIAPAVR
ncbi:MAG TPA: serine hydrolase [Pseudonocardiaceae bacterium]